MHPLTPEKGISAIQGRVDFSPPPGPQVGLRRLVQLWQDGGSSQGVVGGSSFEFRFDDVKEGSPAAIRILSFESVNDGAASPVWYLYPESFQADVKVLVQT